MEFDSQYAAGSWCNFDAIVDPQRRDVDDAVVITDAPDGLSAVGGDLEIGQQVADRLAAGGAHGMEAIAVGAGATEEAAMEAIGIEHLHPRRPVAAVGVEFPAIQRSQAADDLPAGRQVSGPGRSQGDRLAFGPCRLERLGRWCDGNQPAIPSANAAAGEVHRRGG